MNKKLFLAIILVGSIVSCSSNEQEAKPFDPAGLDAWVQARISKGQTETLLGSLRVSTGERYQRIGSIFQYKVSQLYSSMEEFFCNKDYKEVGDFSTNGELNAMRINFLAGMRKYRSFQSYEELFDWQLGYCQECLAKHNLLHLLLRAKSVGFEQSEEGGLYLNPEIDGLAKILFERLLDRKIIEERKYVIFKRLQDRKSIEERKCVIKAWAGLVLIKLLEKEQAGEKKKAGECEEEGEASEGLSQKEACSDWVKVEKP